MSQPASAPAPTHQPTPRYGGVVERPAPTPSAVTLAPGWRAPAPGTQPGGRIRRTLQRTFEGTPGRMRLLGALAAVTAAVFGLVAATALWSSSAALERADHNAAQVVRVQGIYADLLRADAAATNAFLVGGLENPTQRADYDDSLARVAAAVSDAAAAQPADRAALGALNTRVQAYAAGVEQARAYNRQGLPVGATYLSSASSTLRSSALPILDKLREANVDRATDEFGASHNQVALLIVGLLALAVFAYVMVWLARRTHRYLNVPLTIAAGVVLLSLLAASFTLLTVGSRVGTVEDSSFTGTVALASARSSAFDAKSYESLTLIARGSGATYEDKWATQSAAVTADVQKWSRQLPTAWASYVTAHQAIRALDDGGNWDKAVAEAARTDQGSANQLFTAFDTAAASELDSASATMSDQLLSLRPLATGAGWVVLVACLVAALLALTGVNRRVEEYR